MAFTYKIDPALGLIFVIGQDLTSRELMEEEKMVANHPLRQANMKILLDITQGGLDIVWEDVKEIYKMNRKRMANGYELEATAFITQNDYANTFADVFRMLGHDLPLRLGIFDTLSDAITWLGLSEKEAEIMEVQQELMQKLKE